jgi:hypothetical protein
MFRLPVLLFAFALSVACAACFRNETTRYEIAIPDMESEADATRIRTAFADMIEKRHVSDVEVHLADRKLVCSFNNRELGECNLLYAVARAGYDANGWKALPADVEARKKAVPK